MSTHTNSIQVGSIVRITTDNGGRIGGVLLGHAFGSGVREYRRTLGELGITQPGRTTIDTGASLVTIEGYRITSLVAA